LKRSDESSSKLGKRNSDFAQTTDNATSPRDVKNQIEQLSLKQEAVKKLEIKIEEAITIPEKKEKELFESQNDKRTEEKRAPVESKAEKETNRMDESDTMLSAVERKATRPPSKRPRYYEDDELTDDFSYDSKKGHWRKGDGP
jgi:hypothetical protein